jgi:hypothetical protein
LLCDIGGVTRSAECLGVVTGVLHSPKRGVLLGRKAFAAFSILIFLPIIWSMIRQFVAA